MADQFDGSIAPTFQQVDTSQPGVIDQLKVAWTDFATKLKDDPDFNNAVLQFGAAALQPRGRGVSDLGHAAGAFAGAAGNLKAVRERKAQEKIAAEAATRTETRADLRIGQTDEQIALQKSRDAASQTEREAAREERTGIRAEGAETRELQKEKLSVQIKNLREGKNKQQSLLEIEASARAADVTGSATPEQKMIIQIKDAERAAKPLDRQKVIIDGVTRAKIEHENNPLKRGINFDDKKAVKEFSDIYDLTSGKTPAAEVNALDTISVEKLQELAGNPVLLKQAIVRFGLKSVQQAFSNKGVVLRSP